MGSGPIHDLGLGVKVYETSRGFRVVWPDPSKADGRGNTVRVDLDDALQIANEWREVLEDRQLRRDAFAPGRDNSHRTVGQLLDFALDPANHVRQLAPSTLGNRQSRLPARLAAYRSMSCAELQVQDFADIIADLRSEGYAESSVKTNADDLAWLVRVADRAGFLDKKAFDREDFYVRPESAYKVQGQDEAYVPPEQRATSVDVEKLALAFETSNRHWWRGLQTRLAGFSGLRIGEQLALQARDVDLDRRRIEVRRQVQDGIGESLPKYGKVRVTYYPKELDEAMRGRASELEGPDDLWFPAPLGGHHRSSGFTNRDLWRARQAAGGRWLDKRDDIPDRFLLTWHSLRHHFATWCLDPKDQGGMGLAVRQVSALLGHSSPTITWSTYVSVAADVEDAFHTADEERRAFG